MSDPFDTVKDSSIWYSSKDHAVAEKKDGYIRIGIVQKIIEDQAIGEVRYLVELQDYGNKVLASCRMMRRFGGVYNYEDSICQGYSTNDKPDPVSDFSAKAGDVVLVAYLNGQAREGVILGGLTHPAREMSIVHADGPQYKSEFNGLEHSINADGEFTLTFKGQPTNLSVLDNTPSGKIAAPQYDTTIGSTFMKFDKSGGWQVSDNASSDPMSIKVDKAAGVISLAAGKVSLSMTKASEAVSLTCKTAAVNATESMMTTTKDYSVDATGTAKIKSPKIAIGTDGVELLDQLVKLIDAVAKVKPISPVGPCVPMMATAEWAAVEAIKAKITQIKGSL
jgi:hypothetical protein